MWMNYVPLDYTEDLNLSAGSYEFHCNLSVENMTSDTQTVIINKAENPVSLYLNNFENQNTTVEFGQNNVIGTSLGGIPVLLRDNIVVSNPDFVNLGSGVYSKLLTFSNAGTFDYNITCNQTGHSTLIANDTYTVNAATTLTTTLNSPTDGNDTQNLLQLIEINCSATTNGA